HHSQHGRVCDVKVPLYIYARFLDVEASWRASLAYIGKDHQGWVVTNTRLTGDALQYGTCAGLRLWTWDHPAGKGLKDVIDKIGLYPVTCITSISSREKESLLSRQIVLCRHL